MERAILASGPMGISRQVVPEYLSVLTRPHDWPIAITRADALNNVNGLIGSFDIFEDGPRVTGSLVALCRKVSVGGQQIHDANIVATMLTHGAHKLLTFNFANFSRYGDRIELVGR